MKRRRSVTTAPHLLPAASGMRVLAGLRAPFLAACPSGESGERATTCSHAFAAPAQVLLAEGADDADVQQRLGVLRIDRQRLLELRDRAVGLVRVVVRHAEVGRDVRVARVERQRLLVPRDRLRVLLGVEEHVAQLHARLRVLRVLPGDASASACTRAWIERRRLRAAAAGCCAGRGLRHRRRRPARCAVACWLPSTQPTIRPNRVPAMPKTMESALMRRILRIATSGAASPPARGRRSSSRSGAPCHARRRCETMLFARSGILGGEVAQGPQRQRILGCWRPARSTARRAA